MKDTKNAKSKALIVCLVILIIGVLTYGAILLRSAGGSDSGSEDYQRSVENITYEICSTAEALSDLGLPKEIRLPAMDAAISEHYSYTVPEGYIREQAWLGGEWFANAKAFGFYDENGHYCVARSYITREDIDKGDLESIVLDRLQSAEDVKDIQHKYEEYDFGKVLVCSYRAVAEDEPDLHAVEYSWADDDGTICSLEISSESEDFGGAAKKLIATVHRAQNDFSNIDIIEQEKQLEDEEGYESEGEWTGEDPEAFEAEMAEELEKAIAEDAKRAEEGEGEGGSEPDPDYPW